MSDSHAGHSTSVEDVLAPVRKTVDVECPRERAFRIFTAEVGSWWPLATYSVGKEKAVSCAFEPHAGGQLYEVDEEGKRSVWAEVLTWDPPKRIELNWHPMHGADQAQNLQILFHEQGATTRVELIHSRWEALGEEAAKIRGNYDGGWNAVLNESFAQACRRP